MTDRNGSSGSNSLALLITYPINWPLYHLSARQALNARNVYSYEVFDANKPFASCVRDINLLERTSCIFLSSLLSSYALLILSLIYVLPFYLLKQHLICIFCNIKFDNVVIGDQLLSQFLRGSSSGQVDFSARMTLNIIRTCFRLPFITCSLRKHISGSLTKLMPNCKLHIYSLLPHVVRYEQIVRRYVYYYSQIFQSIELFELYLDRYKRQNIFKSFSSPTEFTRATRSILPFIDLDSNYITQAMSLMGSRLSPNDEHSFFHTGNINPDFDIDPKGSKIAFTNDHFALEDKLLAFPLHQVSDDQFLFGHDDFGDLASYNESIIKYSITNRIPLLIKPHPFAFNVARYPDKCFIELSYLRSLASKYFSLPIEYNFLAQVGIIKSTIYPSLYLMPPKLSLVNFLSDYKNSIILTKHGNVVVEAIYSSMPFLCSVFSRYTFFKFNPNNTYSTKKELFSILDRFFSGHLLPSELIISDQESVRQVVASSLKSNQASAARLNDKYLRDYFLPASPGSASPSDWSCVLSKICLDRYYDLESTAGLTFTSSSYSDMFFPCGS